MKEQLMNYLVTTTGALTLEDILLNFVAAAVIAAVIFFSYRISHSGAVYSPRFNVSLVMLTLVTALVMNVIGNNVALSLGMVGALSIVRFRTPIKDSRDTAYIFWCIAVGICCGVSEYMIAAVGTAVIFGLMLLFGLVKTNDRYLLVVRGDADAIRKSMGLIAEVYGRKAKLRVRNTTAESEECIYEIPETVFMKHKNKGDIVANLYTNAGPTAVNVVCQNEEIGR